MIFKYFLIILQVLLLGMYAEGFLGLPDPLSDVVDAFKSHRVGYRLSQSIPVILGNLGQVAGQGVVDAAGTSIRVAEKALKAAASPVTTGAVQEAFTHIESEPLLRNTPPGLRA